MKSRIFMLFAWFAVSAYAYASAGGYIINDSILDAMTDEEFKVYEDSLLKTLYAPVIEHHYNKPDGISDINKRIEKSLGANSNFECYQLPEVISIDKSKAVGEIAIESGTTPTGGKIYQVPVTCHPGINGFEPQVSLIYNSQQGNSVAGIGWSVGGLSAITRNGSSFYYDGKTTPVGMTADDTFYLDGMRLIHLSTTGNERIYESERDNVKVRAICNGESINKFIVYYPDGREATYGDNTGNLPYYPIVKIRDLNNNSILYVYYKDGYDYAIKNISYNNASIEFKYSTDREDKVSSYIGGVEVRVGKLLNEICVKYGGVMSWKYSLSHITRFHKSFLSQIDFFAGEAAYNPLKFYYGITGDSPSYGFDSRETQLLSWYESTDPGMIKVVKGKFDYKNGQEGLIVLPNKNPYWKHYRNSTMFRRSQNRFNNRYDADVNEKIFLYAGLGDNYASPMPDLTVGNGFIDIFCADLEGQQNECIIKVNNYIESEKDRLVFAVYEYNDIAGIHKKYTRTFDFNTVHTDADGGKSIQPKFYHVGDFDGDGKQEILAVSVHEPFENKSLPSKCMVFDLENNKILFNSYVFDYDVSFVGSQQTDAKVAENNTDKLFTMDYDGDGKTEICHISEQGTRIYSFSGSLSNLTLSPTVFYSGISRSSVKDRDVLLGEMNGDGKMDILVSPAVGGTQWQVYYSNGLTGFIKQAHNACYKFDISGYGYFMQDVDCDGMTDFVDYSPEGFQMWRTLHNSIIADISQEYEITDFSAPPPTLIPVNLMSHNSSSQLLSLNKGVVTHYTCVKNMATETLITAVVNSFGVVEKNRYALLSDKDNIGSAVYIPGTSASFPFVDVIEQIPVLEATGTFVDGNEISRNTFKYENGLFHRQGLGFRGFKKIIDTDILQHTSINTYELSGPSPQLLKKQTLSHNIDYSYNTKVEENKIDRTRLSSVTDIDYTTGLTTETGYTYDIYGNPVSETKLFSDDISVEIISFYENHPEVEYGYRLGVLQWQEKKTTCENETISEATEVWMREDCPWRPAGKHYFVDNLVVKTDLYDYDTTGNITEHKTWNFDHNTQNSQDETFIYDDYGHLIEYTDNVGLKTSYEYDSFGQLKKRVDYRGGTTEYQYDVMGRPCKTINPDNTVEDITYVWSGVNKNEGIYKKIITQMGRPTQQMCYDGLNRVVCRGETRFDGEYLNVFTEYNQSGTIKRVSQPAKGSSDVLWTDYKYDAYDRVTEESEASGRKTTYSYNENSITTVENDIKQTKVYDSLGNIVSVTDPAGEITYELAPDGLPVRVVAPGNVVTTFEYDEYRRRKSMTDPSGGTISYTYNTDDLTCTCTNARGEKIWYFYDQYNRLIKKYSPEDITGYDYDDKGDLVVMGTRYNEGGVTGVKSIAYDVMGRIIFTTDFYGDNESWIQRAYTYQDGNIKQIRYLTDTGFTTTENYAYANGHLTKIKLDDNTVIYELVEENELGMPAKVNTGEFSRFYKFDSYGFPKSRSIINNNNEGCQYIKYDFNPENGLMKSRHDLYNNTAVENFSYDGMNRLVGHGNNQVEYDIKGNITRKSDVGEFAYDTPDKPYAVSSASVYGNAIPERDQEISYFSFDRVKEIKENGYVAKFDYDGYGDRVKMTVTKNNANELTRYYLGGCYEKDITPDYTVEKIYLGGGDYYNSGAVFTRSDSIEDVIYIFRDCLGSITSLGFQGYSVADFKYDPWGRLCNPYDGKLLSDDSEANLALGRGFTGHEHLPWFGLINMNARLYDPALGRFLSPDPYVQMPFMSQNFNRFSYALNNPLLYTDKDGKFLISLFTAATDLIGNVFKHGFNTSQYNWRKTINAWRIDIGMYKGNFMQIVGKRTWGAINSMIGNHSAHILNLLGTVDNVTYMDGMLALSGVTNGEKAFTIGHYSFGPKGYTATWKDNLFVHEYGHYIQSQYLGPVFLPVIGYHSLTSAGFIHKWSGIAHRDRWFEVNASKLGAKYFDKKYGSGKKGYDPKRLTEEYFNINAFQKSGVNSLYRNPRKQTKYPYNNDWYRTSNPQISIWDFMIIL